MVAKDKRQRLRVLLVPDLVPWITGTIAKAIADHNPWIEPTICSSRVLIDFLSKFPGSLKKIDLVHFLTPWESKQLLPHFINQVPCITTIHHVHDWQGVAHNVVGDSMMVVSREWQQYLVKKNIAENRIVRLSLGVDGNVFKPASVQERETARKRMGIDSDSFVIGFCGKQSSDAMNRKGTDIFVEAMKQLSSRLPNLTALIVGPGWHSVVNEIQAYGINCVLLPFAKNHADLVPFYQSLDLYWITSRIEGGPVTLLEAMSCGTCCLTTRVGIAKDVIIDGNNGFFVPFNDANSLVTLSHQLRQNPEMRKRVSDRARETILHGYQWQETTQQARKLYAVGVQQFVQQQNIQPPPVDVMAVAATAIATPEPAEAYLNAIPLKLQRWVRMQEELLWMKQMLAMKERRVALDIGLRTCATYPTAPEPWRRVLSEFTNPRVFRIIKKSKQGVSKLATRFR